MKDEQEDSLVADEAIQGVLGKSDEEIDIDWELLAVRSAEANQSTGLSMVSTSMDVGTRPTTVTYTSQMTKTTRSLLAEANRSEALRSTIVHTNISPQTAELEAFIDDKYNFRNVLTTENTVITQALSQCYRVHTTEATKVAAVPSSHHPA